MMRAVKRWTSVVALVLSACGPSEPALPSIVSVTPASMAANESVLLTVDLQGAFPLRADYKADFAQLFTPASLSIADRRFDILRSEEKGKRLLVEILPPLPEGPQQLRVDLTDGRQVVFADGFEVTPPLAIDNLAIDPITTQIRLRPFNIRIRVAGPDAELFHGRVKLRVSRGTITPPVSGSFTDGTTLTEVTVDATEGANITITAEDYAGHTVTSNDFLLKQN